MGERRRNVQADLFHFRESLQRKRIAIRAREIVVIGANKTEVVHVVEIAFESEESFMRAHTTS